MLVIISYYHPSQHGRYSIKVVLPALTGKSYSSLAISKGDKAAREFLEIMYKGNPKGRNIERVRKDILIYCNQDTESLRDILGVIKKVVGKD